MSSDYLLTCVSAPIDLTHLELRRLLAASTGLNPFSISVSRFESSSDRRFFKVSIPEALTRLHNPSFPDLVLIPFPEGDKADQVVESALPHLGEALIVLKDHPKTGRNISYVAGSPPTVYTQLKSSTCYITDVDRDYWDVFSFDSEIDKKMTWRRYKFGQAWCHLVALSIGLAVRRKPGRPVSLVLDSIGS